MRRRATVGFLAALGVVVAATAAWATPSPILTATGGASASVAVLPPSGSPIRDVVRDCGFSVELSDGKSLWIFCDTTKAGSFDRNSSAAFTEPSASTVLREYLDGFGRPAQFVPDNDAVCTATEDSAPWPISASTRHGGDGKDHVVVYFDHKCATDVDNNGTPDPGATFRTTSIGVAEYTYSPGRSMASIIAAPATATIRKQALFAAPPESSFDRPGTASVFDADTGKIVLYQCPFSASCAAARVAPSEIATASAYKYWTGAAWTGSAAQAARLTLPAGNGASAQEVFGYLKVVHLDDLDLFAMAYFADFGVGDELRVRVSVTPEGPWSAPIRIDRSWECGAFASVSTRCYHAGISESGSNASSIVLTYIDQVVGGGQTRQPRWIRQPIAVTINCVDSPTWIRDVSAAHPFFAEIAWMVVNDISNCDTSGRFNPTSPVTRQAFAAWLYRLTGSPEGPFPDPGFTDVPSSHPFATEIAWMKATGVTNGNPDGTFGPTGALTRQALVAFLQRWNDDVALVPGGPGPWPDPGFSDVTAANPFYDAISWSKANGVVNGYADGTFKPGVTAQRQAVAAFLYRLAGPG